MKNKSIGIIGFLFLIAWGCSSSGKMDKMYVGVMHGGIVENTDLSLLAYEGLDAYTGATSLGLMAGFHREFQIGKLSLESGLDGCLNNQTFVYHDDYMAFQGQRDMRVSQFRVPVLVNFGLFSNTLGEDVIRLRFGISPGLSFCKVRDTGLILPEYKQNYFTAGPLFGVEIVSIHIANGSALGVSFEVFRSFQMVYSDFYQLGEMPGLSYFKFGVVYRFSTD